MTKRKCEHCDNGWLHNRYGQDVECVNGVLIDIDVATEGWQRDTIYPAAPCEYCAYCQGSTESDGQECPACNGTGWKSGQNESQNLLIEWALT